ncbi:60S ribosomal protein L24 [Acropora cervicornis]|uniref:Large ribosomal subunit protein eL24 n=3 Tax=Acropora TaxID=6127 RepID=A0AAD9PX81_ACRCE|nr:60S ribosomal protein L24 [Acropora cervicornis]
MRRNPRKISWTVLYRRKHKKGTTEEVSKKRTRRNVKFQRPVQGATLEEILAKRNQKPEVRKALREQALRAAKEKAKAKIQQKKLAKGQQATPQQAAKPKQKAAKPVQAKAPRVGGKR